MKKWIAIVLSLGLYVALINTNASSNAFAAEVTEVDEITLKQTPHQVEGWTIDGTYSISQPNSIVKGKNEYMAVGQYGTIMKSKDGKSWTTLTKFANYQLSSITYNGDVYLLAGANTTYGDEAINKTAELFVSTDGLSWQEVDFSFHDAIQYVEWGNGEFLASGKKGLYRSVDGHNWEQTIEHEETYYYHPLQFVNGTYFLYVYENNQVYTSKDGKAWSKHTYDVNSAISQFIWYKDQYVGIGDGIYKSSDGIKWTKLASSPSNVLFGSIATDGQAVVVMGNGDYESSNQVVYMSKSLTSWSKQSLKHFGHNYFAVYPVADGFAGLAYSDNSSIYSMYSKDGLSWSHKLIGANVTGSFNALASNGKRVVAVGSQGSLVYTDNGTKWNSAAALTPNHSLGRPYFNDVEYGANKFIAVGNEGIYSSKDGLTWARVPGFTHNGEGMLSELIWTGQYFLASGQTSGVYYSKDGTSWSKVSTVSQNGQWLMSMVFDGKRVVAGFQLYNNGNQYIQLMQTTNGTTWSKLTTFNTLSIELAYNGEAYIAVDPYDMSELWVSKDAKNWSRTSAAVAKDDNFYTLTTFEGYFVAFNMSLVKQDGDYVKQTNYYSSKDGMTWKKHEVPAIQDEHIFGDETIYDGIKAFGKYIFVGSQGYILSTADLQLEDPIYITVDGQTINQTAEQGKAYIEKGTTYLPLRVIGEAIGFEIIWNGSTKSVTFKNEAQTATFADVQLKNGLSYVPLRKVSEQLGYTVNYEKVNSDIFVSITSK